MRSDFAFCSILQKKSDQGGIEISHMQTWNTPDIKKKSDQGGIEIIVLNCCAKFICLKKSDQGGIEMKFLPVLLHDLPQRNQTKVGLKSRVERDPPRRNVRKKSDQGGIEIRKACCEGGGAV